MSDFKYITDISGESGSMVIDGSFGGDILGADIAAEIYYLDKVAKVKDLHIYMNSVGGKVFDSLSVVSAILGANATTHGHNNGLCASSAFHTILSCDKIHAFDYSIFMYHNPYDPSGANPALSTVRDSMVTLISNRLNKSEEEVSAMLDTETFIKARDFEKTFGLEIDIKPSTRKPNITASMTIDEIVAEYNNFNNNKNEQTMPEFDINNVCAKLDLDPSAANVVTKIEAKVDAILAENVSLAATNKKLAEDNKTMKTELSAFAEVEAKAYVAGLLKDNLITKDSVEKIEAEYKANPEAIKAAFDSIPAPAASETIENKTLDRGAGEEAGKVVMEYVGEGEKKVAKDYQWYMENASAELAEMQTSNPEKFNFLLTEYTKED